MKLFWDCETEGLPAELIAPIMPEFEAGANLKDPLKIAAAIEEKKRDWLDRTALKAITGRIVAVTTALGDDEPEMNVDDEPKLITNIVGMLKGVIGMNQQAYAWNGSGFDLPFICQRAAVYDIPAFRDLTVNVRGKFYWHESLIDPKLVWSNYSPDHTGSSLKSVAYALGLGLKEGSGADFAGLLKTNPDAAKAYALMDVELLRGVVRKMGI